MSHVDFRDPRTPEEIIQARLVNPLRRRAAPLAAWFMLTAVMAGHSAVVATALARRDWDEEFSIALLRMVMGGVAGASIGGLSGFFDQTPVRGGALGTAMGALAGITAMAAASIPGTEIDLAFHASALAALGIFAAALFGRWRR